MGYGNQRWWLATDAMLTDAVPCLALLCRAVSADKVLGTGHHHRWQRRHRVCQRGDCKVLHPLSVSTSEEETKSTLLQEPSTGH